MGGRGSVRAEQNVLIIPLAAEALATRRQLRNSINISGDILRIYFIHRLSGEFNPVTDTSGRRLLRIINIKHTKLQNIVKSTATGLVISISL